MTKTLLALFLLVSCGALACNDSPITGPAEKDSVVLAEAGSVRSTLFNSQGRYVATAFYFSPSTWGTSLNSFTASRELDGSAHSIQEVNTRAVGCTNCTNTYLMRPVYEIGDLPAVSDQFTFKIVGKKREATGDSYYYFHFSTPSGQGAVYIDSPGYPCRINTTSYKTCYFYFGKTWAPDTKIFLNIYDNDNTAGDTVANILDIDSIEVVQGRNLF
jgi:hypothetical protein